jgi:tRNA (guanine10-N2)-methyltransferase
MHEQNRDVRSQWSQYIPDTSFKFFVGGYNRSISQSHQREIINSFSYMALLGKIDMNNPQITFGCFEERAFDSDVHCALLLIVATDEDSRRISKNRGLLQVYFGRLVCSPSRWKFDGPIIVLSRSRKDRLDLLSRDLTLRDVNTLEIQAWRQKYLC